MSGPNDAYDPKAVAALDPDELERITRDGSAAFAAASDLDALAAAHGMHLGDRSPVRLANRELGALPPHARADAGRRVNAARRALEEAHEKARLVLLAERDARALGEERVDVTLPWDRFPAGAQHPLTLVTERIADLFVAMGYEVAEGPEVEAEWFNFDALNMNRDHPARSTQDTLYVDAPDSGRLLRTQTSPVQIRTLLERRPPVYVICPGRVFRADAPDATHSPVFNQVEGLVVDEGITMAHLRGTLDAFARGMFGPTVTTRLRPSYFPFTEPSAEMDLRCFVCGGAGCRTCGSEGWIEWGGCGMVNPRVLRTCGVDPDRYSGFAFGMGIERTLMFRHDVKGIRDIVEGDVRFTRALGREV